MIELLYAKPVILWTATIIASFIVIIGWLFIFFHVTKTLNEKVSSSLVEDEVENKLGIYFICVSFWPAALVMGNNFLKKPETAETGRTCITIFLWFSTFIVMLSVTTVFTCVAYLPEILNFFEHYNS